MLFQIFNHDGIGIPVVPLYIDENNIAFYLNDSDLPTDENKHTIFFYKGGMETKFASNHAIIDNMPIEFTFIDEQYGRVCYLDSTTPKISFIDNVLNLKEVQLNIISANTNITGNIVLIPIVNNVELDPIIVPVSDVLTIQKISLDVTGNVSFRRDYENTNDTLKDGIPVTAIIANIRFIVEV